MKFLSVVVPIYNVERYLAQCLDSILSQSFKDIEVILVDDGSTDSSGNICDYYKKQDSRIKVIHKKNEGLGMARNTGLKLATGDYVAFVDSDDYLGKELFAQLLKPILKENCDTSLGGCKEVNDGQVLSVTKYSEKIIYGKDVYFNLFATMLGSTPSEHDSMRMSVWSAIYNLKIIKENNIIFPSEHKLISEDIVFDQIYYQYAQKVAISESTDYYYRFNPDSLSRKYRFNKFEKCRDLYKYFDNIIDWFNLNSTGKLRWQKKFINNVQVSIFQENKKISNKKFFQRYKTIKKICNDKTVRKVFEEYPAKKMRFKPRIFVELVKRRMALVLTLVVG